VRLQSQDDIGISAQKLNVSAANTHFAADLFKVDALSQVVLGAGAHASSAPSPHRLELDASSQV
jgi:hypothetical protein